MVIDEDVEILFNLLVDPFCLSIDLGMLCHQRVTLDPNQFVEVSHEFRLKLGASIVDDLPGNAMEPEDMVPIVFCHAMCC